MATLYILLQFSCDCNLHADSKLLYAIRNISPICLEYLTAVLCIGHPEDLLTWTSLCANISVCFGNVTCYGISVSRCSTISQSLCQLNCFCTTNLNSISCRRCVTATIFKYNNITILDFRSNLTRCLVHILHQLASQFHLHANLEFRNAFRKICIICLEHFTATLFISHPEGLLIATYASYDLCDITSYGISICRSSIVGQSVRQLDSLSACNFCAFNRRSVATFIIENDYVGVLHLANHTTIVGIDVLHQLTGNLHFCSSLKLRNAFGKVCPISFEHLTAVLCIGHPESLLIATYITYDLSNVTGNCVKIGRSCTIGQSLSQFDSLSTSDRNSLNGFRATT